MKGHKNIFMQNIKLNRSAKAKESAKYLESGEFSEISWKRKFLSLWNKIDMIHFVLSRHSGLENDIQESLYTPVQNNSIAADFPATC